MRLAVQIYLYERAGTNIQLFAYICVPAQHSAIKLSASVVYNKFGAPCAFPRVVGEAFFADFLPRCS